VWECKTVVHLIRDTFSLNIHISYYVLVVETNKTTIASDIAHVNSTDCSKTSHMTVTTGGNCMHDKILNCFWLAVEIGARRLEYNTLYYILYYVHRLDE